MKRLLAIISLLFVFNIGIQSQASGELSTEEYCKTAVAVANIAVRMVNEANNVINNPNSTAMDRIRANKKKQEGQLLYLEAQQAYTSNRCGEVIDEHLPPLPQTQTPEF